MHESQHDSITAYMFPSQICVTWLTACVQADCALLTRTAVILYGYIEKMCRKSNGCGYRRDRRSVDRRMTIVDSCPNSPIHEPSEPGTCYYAWLDNRSKAAVPITAVWTELGKPGRTEGGGLARGANPGLGAGRGRTGILGVEADEANEAIDQKRRKKKERKYKPRPYI